MTHDCDCHFWSRNGDSDLGDATAANCLDVVLASLGTLNEAGRFSGRNGIHSDDRGGCDAIALRGSCTYRRLGRLGCTRRSVFVGPFLGYSYGLFDGLVDLFTSDAGSSCLMLTCTKVEVNVCLTVVIMTVVDSPVPTVYVRTLSLVMIETFEGAEVTPAPCGTVLLGFWLALDDPLWVGNVALGPVPTETELDGRRLALGPVPRGTELEGKRLALGPVPRGTELDGERLALGPVPRGTDLDGERLALGLVPRGTELDGRRLADTLVVELTETGLTVDPVPIGAGTAPYP